MFRISPCLLAWITLLCLCLPAGGETAGDRFFLAGDGKIHIKNGQNSREASVELLQQDGSFNEKGLTQIDEVFGVPTDRKGEHISLRLLFMLDYFSDLVAPGRVIVLTSGYRSPEYNSKLRDAGGIVAKTSVHMDGMALDFYIDGVQGKELWELIKSRNCCGAGYYGGTAVHLDASRPRYWEASTSKVKTNESDYNRKMYLSTDYDVYHPGDTARLFLSSVSDFGFGIRPAAVLVNDPEGQVAAASGELKAQVATECIAVPDREASRGLLLSLPQGLAGGKYRVRLDFCRKPFEQMPNSVLSNEFQIRK